MDEYTYNDEVEDEDLEPEETKKKGKKKRKRNAKNVKISKTLQHYHHPVIKWWQKPSIQYAMTLVREIMEKLMGSNLVTPLDRNYMEKLKVRILEDFDEQMLRRIKVREEIEYQRVKNLVLTGKIPFDEAPREMDDHIVIILENYCNELIERRRAGYKIPKPKIPTYLYFDDTPDPASFLTVEKGHKFRKGEVLCKPIDTFLDPIPIEEEDEEEEVDMLTDEAEKRNKFIYDDEDYRRLKYTNIMIRHLMKLLSVLSIYDYADEIMKKDNLEILQHIIFEQEVIDKDMKVEQEKENEEAHEENKA